MSDITEEIKQRVKNGLSPEMVRLSDDYERLKTQLRLCEAHARTMAHDFDHSLAVVQGERDQLKKTLLEYNDALRSCCEVARRAGLKTNWETFSAMVEKVLEKNHAVWIQAVM